MTIHTGAQVRCLKHDLLFQQNLTGQAEDIAINLIYLSDVSAEVQPPVTGRRPTSFVTLRSEVFHRFIKVLFYQTESFSQLYPTITILPRLQGIEFRKCSFVRKKAFLHLCIELEPHLLGTFTSMGSFKYGNNMNNLPDVTKSQIGV